MLMTYCAGKIDTKHSLQVLHSVLFIFMGFLPTYLVSTRPLMQQWLLFWHMFCRDFNLITKQVPLRINIYKSKQTACCLLKGLDARNLVIHTSGEKCMQTKVSRERKYLLLKPRDTALQKSLFKYFLFHYISLCSLEDNTIPDNSKSDTVINQFISWKLNQIQITLPYSIVITKIQRLPIGNQFIWWLHLD